MNGRLVAGLLACCLSGPAFAQTTTWTGFYIGANAGYAWGDLEVDAPPERAQFDLDGPLVGVTGGYNFATNGYLFGLEADYAWADIGVADTCGQFDCSFNTDTFGTVRARVGLANNAFLFYATGGFAWAQQDVRLGTFSASVTATGWAGGVGMEGAVTERLSAKLEGLWYDLGWDRYDLPRTPVDARHNGVMLRAGLNYRFNWGR